MSVKITPNVLEHDSYGDFSFICRTEWKHAVRLPGCHMMRLQHAAAGATEVNTRTAEVVCDVPFAPIN